MLDHLTSLFAPHECLACRAEGSLLCAACSTSLRSLPTRCYRCREYNTDSRTCARCRKTSKLHVVQAATEYADVAKDIVWRLKFSHARAAIGPMARTMQQRIVFDDDTLLVHIPTATSRQRQRGYDQAALLCRELSRRTGLPRARALARYGQARQVGAIRAERMRHLAGAFRIRDARNIAGRHVVLIDDVLTTGATLEAAAHVLRQAGATRVDAIVFAQA